MDTLNYATVLQLIFGCIALLAGRNIFWLFIALAGFLIGFEFAGIWFVDQVWVLQISVALGAGLLGALLAVVFERVAFSLAGFYVAAYLAVIMIDRMGVTNGETAIIIFSGLVGALLAALALDWAIIVLSALFGSAAIVSTFSMPPGIEVTVFIVLATVGIVVQRSMFVQRQSS